MLPLSRLRRRKIRYFFAHLPYLVVSLPLLPFSLLVYGVMWAVLKTSIVMKRGTLCIVNSYNNDPTFVSVTRRALALIEQYDPKRWRLLQAELRYIDDVPLVPYADYEAAFRRCRVNFAAIDFAWNDRDAPNYADYYTWYLAHYAATLVHEASHGRLNRLGFAYTKQTRARIERICEREARRFAACLPQNRYNFARDLVSPFDPSRWDYLWHTPRWKLIIQVIRQAKKDIKNDIKRGHR